MPVSRWTFISDTHVQNQLPQAIALVAARQKDYKPQIFVAGGDMLEFSSVTHWVRTRMMENKSPHFLREEAESFIESVLAPICDSLPNGCRKIAIEGNHEHWAIQYIGSRAPALDGLIDLDDILGYKRFGFEYVPSKKGNGIKTIGPVHFMHGCFCGEHPAAMHLKKFGGPCVVCGHTHRQDYKRQRLGNGRDEVCLVVGCLSGPGHQDFDNYTRGFGEGCLNEETNEFEAHFANISGDRYDYLYLPDAEYSAKCRYDKNGGEHWTASRVADSKRKGVPT